MKSSAFDILQAATFNAVGDSGLKDSSLSKTALHALAGGLLAEAMGSDFRSGAIAAGANEALMQTLNELPLLNGSNPQEHQQLVNTASKLVGLIAAASAGGDYATGSEIAGNAQAYNRQLHSFERKLLDDKAQELQQNVGNTKSGVSWETLLTLVGGAAVDSEDSQKLAALEASLKDNNPENVSLKQDLAQAQQVIDQLRSQRIALHWSNGDAIVADGDKVYAFSATDAQRQDHALFDVASNTGLYNAPGNDPVVPDKYVQQFGEYVAAKHQSEIASVSSDTIGKDENWAALQSRTNGGLNDVTGIEVLGVLPPGRAVRAGTVLSTTLQATAREAEESIAGGLAKAVSQDASRTGVPQWTVAAEDTYGARLAGSYKAGDTAYNGAAASDSAYGFNFGLTARESGAATRSDISDAMRADPYHPDWKSYVGGEARAVGADVTRTASGTPEFSGAKETTNVQKTTNSIIVSGNRAIDKAQSYESGVREMYGGTKAFDERQFRAVVDGKVVSGVADDVAVIGGKKTAVEAKFVEDWGSSLRNPASEVGSKPWSIAEQTKMVEQAKKYSSGFDGGVVYHTNSPELASYYSKLFTDAGVTKFKFLITPAKN